MALLNWPTLGFAHRRLMLGHCHTVGRDRPSETGLVSTAGLYLRNGGLVMSLAILWRGPNRERLPVTPGALRYPVGWRAAEGSSTGALRHCFPGALFRGSLSSKREHPGSARAEILRRVSWPVNLTQRAGRLLQNAERTARGRCYEHPGAGENTSVPHAMEIPNCRELACRRGARSSGPRQSRDWWCRRVGALR